MNDTHHPAEIIERASTPRGEIQLQRRGEFYEIISNGTFLMATYNGESERLLVRRALEQAKAPGKVLIGGLGVGFSLQEALSDPRVREVTVVEIETKVIEWNRTVLAPVSDYALRHPKTRLVHADLIAWIRETDETFDLICLDIDNGPDWKVFDGNASLYDNRGLQALGARINPDGCITFWSATPSPEFAGRLNAFFGNVEIRKVPQSHRDPDYVFLVRAGGAGQ
ncbi:MULTISPECIES: spermine/spermidine synthase domain-containing protein [Paenibacillus]|uniref:Spermine/spermidine synthase family protein n=1 Tax=Paenibacillus macerans TaxID=44252 RepID=A0A090ZXE4_PAEMA|nr:spermine/spermidine synthase [Paenibacillus macerans]KFN08801.1 spermine/spermidine synthase family protein [Paenibacillus macerans]MBS5914916.1 spermine/spermidine synthase [Paenibacillus macerans]MCY7560079.1 spermine/spermidine synthase [Paenibacillus macerans]MEC0150459.1 spermine/spermidine synthase [Paenibacillus macerans]SUA83377.1 spermidine synthase [Paenibacillus macerans]